MGFPTCQTTRGKSRGTVYSFSDKAANGFGPTARDCVETLAENARVDLSAEGHTFAYSQTEDRTALVILWMCITIAQELKDIRFRLEQLEQERGL